DRYSLASFPHPPRSPISHFSFFLLPSAPTTIAQQTSFPSPAVRKGPEESKRGTRHDTGTKGFVLSFVEFGEQRVGHGQRGMDMKRGHYVVDRSLNNNVIVVRSPEGDEEIFIGRGLGFGIRRGDSIDPEDPRIEKRFTLADPDHRAKFKQLYTVVSDEVIGIA